MLSYFFVLASTRVISPFRAKQHPPLRVGVLFALSGLIFPIMAGVLYIIPYIFTGIEQTDMNKKMKTVFSGIFIYFLSLYLFSNSLFYESNVP